MPVARYIPDTTNAGNITSGTLANARLPAGAAAYAATAVKTGPYTATAGEFVPVNTTSGNVTITLPAAPADRTMVGVKQVVRGGTNTVTVAAGGSDVFNVAAGSTSLTLTVVGQAVNLEYSAAGAIWYVTAADIPYGTFAASAFSGTASTSFNSIVYYTYCGGL